MNYYISDIHFGDERILKLCKRPFNTLDDMNNYIIQKWNSRVSNTDTVYILGDIGFDDKSINIYKKLNGIKILIIGNHDLAFIDEIKKSRVFNKIDYTLEIKDSVNDVFLCHYPVVDWPGIDEKSVLLYGHIHNKTSLNDIRFEQIKNYYKDKKAFNCSADVIGFEPRTLKELMKLKEANSNESYIN